ncbi:MAG: diguanylate cyclase [Desulfococcaceae bacterium]|nr:diguanylate cyclase [Desulfococcaceae bacterium]
MADITHHKHWKEMVGKHDFEVFPHDIAAIYNKEEEPVFREGKPLLNKVNPYCSADGKTGYVQTSKWPIFDDENAVSGIFGISRDITGQKKAAEALERERNLFAEGPVFTMEWGAEPYGNWSVRYASSNVEQILGYRPAEMLHPEFSYNDIIHPDDTDRIVKELKHHIANRVDSFGQSYRLRTKNGRHIWCYDFTMLIRDEEGSLTAIRSYMYDQSAQKKAEEALRIAEERLEKTAYDLTENIPVGTYTMVQPAHGGMANFAFMSSRFLELTGLTREEAASDPLKGFACVHPDDFDEWVALNAKTFEEKKPFFGETRLVVNGEIRWITAESIPRTLPDGTTVWEGVLADITDRKQAEAILHETNAALEKEVAERRIIEEELRIKTDMLEKLSMRDGLTDIPNRRYFDERANLEWRRAVRSGLPLSLVMMDIDHFKLYNDHYGHGAGDDCLKQVARALMKSCARPSDLVARYGGEEFVALLPETDAEGARCLAEKMRAAAEALSVPHDFSGTAGVVTLSVGVATHGSESVKTDLQHLHKCADQAIYRAKAQGRNRVQGEAAAADMETDAETAAGNRSPSS